MKRTKRWPTLVRWALLWACALGAVVLFAALLNNLDSGQTQEGKRQLEESLRRAAVACYAAEGSYPDDETYLEEHYGVQIDRERYIVRYEVFAENLMPDITVLENVGP
jgi:hypothetical protein